jgi:hypothetical protein
VDWGGCAFEMDEWLRSSATQCSTRTFCRGAPLIKALGRGTRPSGAHGFDTAALANRRLEQPHEPWIAGDRPARRLLLVAFLNFVELRLDLVQHGLVDATVR